MNKDSTKRSSAPSDMEWEKWGEVDPFYGVCTAPGREKGGSRPWNNREFYQTGVDDWNCFEAYWRSYGVDQTSCLEIGAGAGRITKQLAQYFRKVYAVDVSSSMLAVARRFVTETTVEWIVNEGCRLTLHDGSVTAAFSCQVLQHLPDPRYIKMFLAEVARVLRPSGTLMLHIPMDLPCGAGTGVSRRLNRLGCSYDRLKNSLKRHFGLPLMEMKSLPADYFFDEFPALGFQDVRLILLKPIGNPVVHSFVLAKRIGMPPP